MKNYCVSFNEEKMWNDDEVWYWRKDRLSHSLRVFWNSTCKSSAFIKGGLKLWFFKKNRFKSSRLLIQNPKMYSPPSLREYLHFLGQERCIFYYSKKSLTCYMLTIIYRSSLKSWLDDLGYILYYCNITICLGPGTPESLGIK